MIAITAQEALDINFLKANCKKIHFFGLGFIQIKLSDAQRVHVYTDKLTPTVKEEDIHNHRYNFTSQILKGTLRQKTYIAYLSYDGSDHVCKKESCNPDIKVENEEISEVDVQTTGEQTFVAGSSYWLSHEVFHRVTSTDAVTLLTRSDYKKDMADIIYDKHFGTICPFSVKVTEEELWKIVEEAL